MEHEFTEQHKDAFVRSQGEAKKPPTPAPGQGGAPRPSHARPPSNLGNPLAQPKPAAPKPPAPKAPGQGVNPDDFVPEKVGQVVDNVFGKLDNLVNDAADYLFGNKKKGGGLLDGDQFQKSQPPTAVPPLMPQAPPVAPLQSQPQAKAPVAPAAPAAPPAKAPAKPPMAVRTLSTLQGSHKPEMIRPVMPESKPKFDGPVISRTTSISELDLPLEILDDPDLPRYFDQMKLYEPKVVEGGLCNVPQFEAEQILRKGRWKEDFLVRFENLRGIQPGIYPMEMAKSRFLGMRPVYKALAGRYPNREHLAKAIEEDINAYLADKQGKHFHPFIYKVVSTGVR